MPAQVKLLGPDLGSPLLVEVDASDTIAGLKDRALAVWPAGAPRSRGATVWRGAFARSCDRPPRPHACLAGMDVPAGGQIRIIYQGRFMADNQSLKGARCDAGQPCPRCPGRRARRA